MFTRVICDRDKDLSPLPGHCNGASSSTERLDHSSSDLDERQACKNSDIQSASKAEMRRLLALPGFGELQEYQHHQDENQHDGGSFALPYGKRLRRGDSLLFEVADSIPPVGAPAFVVSPLIRYPLHCCRLSTSLRECVIKSGGYDIKMQI